MFCDKCNKKHRDKLREILRETEFNKGSLGNSTATALDISTLSQMTTMVSHVYFVSQNIHLMSRNSISFSVSHFDNNTFRIQGNLDIDLFEPLRAAKTRVAVTVAGRNVTLGIPLTEFYNRKLTGRYSVPISLDLSEHMRTQTLAQITSVPPAVVSKRDPCALTVAERLAKSGFDTNSTQYRVDNESSTPKPAVHRLVALNDSNLTTVWLFGVFPVCVMRIELIIMKVENSVISLLVKVQSGRFRPQRVIIEALSKKKDLVARVNCLDVPTFAYGRIVNLCISESMLPQLGFIRSRVDVRFARDPKCTLDIPSL